MTVIAEEESCRTEFKGFEKKKIDAIASEQRVA
jgi:hypothetical protein